MKTFRSKNLLVTGGAGFIGSNFINHIINKYENVNIYNLDSLTYAGNLENTNEFKHNPRYKFIHGNICDFALVSKLFKQYNIDGVINFAAESHVDNSISNPDIFIETNILGVNNLLSIANKFWNYKPFNTKSEFKFARFHQVSTDEVYGSIEKGSFDELSSYNPNSPYSASKASADLLVRSYNKTYGLNTSISISSNNYGKNQNIEKLIPKSISLISKDNSVPLYGSGKNIRDWIHVDDNCLAIDLIYNLAENGDKFNIASKEELTNLELLGIIYKSLDKKEKIMFVKDRFGHDFRYSLNTDKIRKVLGWFPKKNIQDSIKELLIK